MKDKEWCVTDNEHMPKKLLNYGYIITNELNKTILEICSKV